jgi:hypothetical protein
MIVVQSQLRLLVLTTLLLCTALVMPAGPQSNGSGDNVFEQPPAYLHPRSVLAFDLSGLKGQDTTEAALIAATETNLDPGARAQAHLALAIYYKSRGLTQQAVAEKRKGDYWGRIAKHVPTDSSTP